MKLAIASFIVLIMAINEMIEAQNIELKPPIATAIPRENRIHGYREIDDYFWLRDKSNKDVIAYLRSENAYADAMTSKLESTRQALYKEMLGRIKETDIDVPYKKGNYYYYSRVIKGKQYPILCRKRCSIRNQEEVTLDINALARGKAFFSLGAYVVSNDARWLAFTTDETGFRQYNLHVKNLVTGKIFRNLAERVTSVEWGNDNNTLFFSQENEITKRSYQVYRLKLGVKSRPTLLFEESDELFSVGIEKTRSNEFIIIESTSSNTSEIRYLNANDPSGDFRILEPRKENLEYYLDHNGQDFYIRTNDKGKNFRLVKAPLEKPNKSEWVEMIPHRNEVMLESIECFSDHLIAIERQNGIPNFTIHHLPDGKTTPITFQEPVYVAEVAENAEFETDKFRYRYESFVTPRGVYDFQLETKASKLLKQQPVLGGYDSRQYVTKRLYATASDGTKIPISIVYNKGMRRNGKSPLLLEGYGSYGISNDVDFSSTRLSLLNRGVIYAIAHIRGGGELGKGWHDQGKMMVKKNSFTDFVSCAEFLVEQKYTSSERLAIMGGSAGGLLMGAVTNMRPDLFKVVLSYVPFVDVMNTMLDASLPLTVGEYLEWGNPNEKNAYDYMRSYSPYENLEAKAYPTILVRTSFNDSQVMYWEPAKYVAKLRTLKTDANPLLFKIKLEPGGHGGASGRYDRLRDTAWDYAFLLYQFGIK